MKKHPNNANLFKESKLHFKKLQRGDFIIKKSILSILLLFALFIAGCSSDIYSNEFLIDLEKIDTMSIGVVAREGEVVFDMMDAGDIYNVDVKNKEQVEAVLNLLKNIRVEELSQEQRQEIFENPEAFVQKINYEITLSASSETGVDSVKGFVFVLEEGRLIFADPKEWENVEGPFLYISEKKQEDVINGLVEIIEEAKQEFLRWFL